MRKRGDISESVTNHPVPRRARHHVLPRTAIALALVALAATSVGCGRGRQRARLFGPVQLAGFTMPGAPVMGVPSVTAWRTQSETSPLTGTENFVAVTSAPRPFRNHYGDDLYPSLIVQCENGTLGVAVKTFARFDVETVDYEDDARWVSLTTRIGDAAPEDIRFRVGTDDVSAWHQEPESLLSRLESARGGSLAVRFTPTSASAVTAVFELSEIDAIVAHARSACSRRAPQ